MVQDIYIDHHRAWKEQPAKVDHSSLADLIVSFEFLVKIKSAVKGDKTRFPRPSHNYCQ